MKEKNLPDDINKKSLDELTEIANQIITKLENTSELETSIQDYLDIFLSLKIYFHQHI